MKISNSGVDSVEISNLSRAKQSGKTEEKKVDSESSIKFGSEKGSKVELSDDARVLAKGVEAAKASELSDKERIAQIKAKIAARDYNPDLGKVADKILQQHILNN